MSYGVPIKPIYLYPRGAAKLSLWHGQVRTPSRWMMPEIINQVSDAYDISVEVLKGPSRQRHIAWPRQHAMWLMAQQPHLSLPMIGNFLGRHHTTVLAGRDASAKRWAEFNQTAEAA